MKKVKEENITVDYVWFKRCVDSTFNHKLYPNRDATEAAGFIDELVKELQPAPFSRTLDRGCGNGCHCKQLAAKGFDVTGIDLDSSSIRNAKKWERNSMRCYRQNMQIPFGTNSFDHVFNFFTSFGYFNDPVDDRQVIANIISALKPGGTLVSDYINSAPAERKLKTAETKEIDGVIYHITRWTDKKHFFKKIIIDEQLFGQPMEYIEQARKFTIDDFDSLFDDHDLQIRNVSGDYQLTQYDKETSPRIILIARKIKYEKDNI